VAERKATDGKRFQKFIVWQNAHKLVLHGFQLSDGFFQSNLFGLTNQLRRVMVSVPANIAEGCMSTGEGQFKRFINIIQRALAEVEYLLFSTRELKNTSSEEYQETELLRKVVGYYHHCLIASPGKSS
jgi:four helix bundle protein